jgi:hypothetical protein
MLTGLLRGLVWVVSIVAGIFTVGKMIPTDAIANWWSEVSPFNYDPQDKHWNNNPPVLLGKFEMLEWHIKQFTPYTFLGTLVIITGSVFFIKYYLNKKMKFKFYKHLKKGNINQKFDWNQQIPYA